MNLFPWARRYASSASPERSNSMKAYLHHQYNVNKLHSLQPTATTRLGGDVTLVHRSIPASQPNQFKLPDKGTFRIRGQGHGQLCGAQGHG